VVDCGRCDAILLDELKPGYAGPLLPHAGVVEEHAVDPGGSRKLGGNDAAVGAAHDDRSCRLVV
jgi:hypothetical protein